MNSGAGQRICRWKNGSRERVTQGLWKFCPSPQQLLLKYLGCQRVSIAIPPTASLYQLPGLETYHCSRETEEF
jgi:hypothetical protein